MQGTFCICRTEITALPSTKYPVKIRIVYFINRDFQPPTSVTITIGIAWLD